jgi:hypothetical protein
MAIGRLPSDENPRVLVLTALVQGFCYNSFEPLASEIMQSDIYVYQGKR